MASVLGIQTVWKTEQKPIQGFPSIGMLEYWILNPIRLEHAYIDKFDGKNCLDRLFFPI